METPGNHLSSTDRHILATDLDGTLIPLPGNQRNRADLDTLARQIRERGVTLVYITGRHFASASLAIEQFGLPQPDWLISDVGTSVFRRETSGRFAAVADYQQHQDRIIAPLPINELRQRLESVPGLRLQEMEKQGRFKLSFYADAERLDGLVAEIQQQLDQTDAPYSIIHSVDPFNGDGLIDLLPQNISKAHALAWWVKHAELSPDAIVFAGDSGNDLAALTAGYRAIVVGNADRSIAKHAYESHREAGWENRLCLAQGEATSGVLEGCRWFGLIEPDRDSIRQLGATPITDTQTGFRVWAPRRNRVTVEVEGSGPDIRQELIREEGGYFAGCVSGASPGWRYRYLLDDEVSRPDPTSSFQPDGVHGPSQIVDHRAFPWTDQDWSGVQKRDLVIYELHIGTFTKEGTFRAAIERIPELLELGVTAVELMPVTQSPGRWNWGYDGVDLFAIRNTYGQPDDFKTLVDACHDAGLAVILDVVYNHVGPEGNYLADFGPYRSSKHHTPWGDAFNFDDHGSKQVRRFVIENAIYWLETYHVDGLRLDATHFIQDDSDMTIVDELCRAVADRFASADRTVHLIAETNVYDQAILQERDNRPPYDAIWCDCLMHSIYSHALPDLRLTDREYLGAGDLAESLQHGYVFAGENQARVRTSEAAGGIRTGYDRRHIESFVIGLQTHDAVGNHPRGQRIHQLTSKAFQKAAAGLTMLYPGIPLLFMGEEVAIEACFPFFVDFEDPQLRDAVDAGRAEEYPQHLWGDVTSPSDAAAFYQAKCHDIRLQDREMFQWYRDLIALRKTGIAEGWLAVDRMSTSHSEADNVFTLQFACEDEGRLFVQARLASSNQPALATVALAGSILLSSQPSPTIGNGHVSLDRNHVVISKTK